MTCLPEGVNKLVVEADWNSGQCSFCTISQWGKRGSSGSQVEQDSFGTRKGKLSNKAYRLGGRKEVLMEDSRWKGGGGGAVILSAS